MFLIKVRQAVELISKSLAISTQNFPFPHFWSHREQMEVYRESSPLQVEDLGKEMKAVVDRLGQHLLEQFNTEIRVSGRVTGWNTDG